MKPCENSPGQAPQTPQTVGLCTGPLLGATRIAGSLTASLTSLKGCGRVKGETTQARHRPPQSDHGGDPRRFRCPAAKACQEPRAHWPRAQPPGPITEGGCSAPNGGAAGGEAVGACALGPARGRVLATWGLPLWWPRFLAVLAPRSFEVRRRSCLPRVSQTRSLLRPCGDPPPTPRHPTHHWRPQPLTRTGTVPGRE